jgi:creatinine amidohydrolase
MSNDGAMSFSPRNHHLGAARWPDLTNIITLLIPIGSCEQHGPHLPLDTDTQIAQEIAARSAARSSNCYVAPAMSITASGEHQGFPGTLSIGNEALILCVVELCRSADWAHRIILVNGHGGNFAAVTSACNTLHGEGRHVVAWWPKGSPDDLHAGRIETSVMLSIAPKEVALPSMTSGPIPTIDDLATLGVQSLSPTGVLGDPTGATAAEGEQWLSAWVDDLANIIRDNS